MFHQVIDEISQRGAHEHRQELLEKKLSHNRCKLNSMLNPKRVLCSELALADYPVNDKIYNTGAYHFQKLEL